MADARSLLRQQRAARQQAQKPQRQSAAPAAVPSSKKRKAADDAVEERKRTRTEEDAGMPAGFFDAGATEDVEKAQLPPSPPVQEPLPVHTKQVAPPPPDPAAEAELDAFMMEMEQERPPPQPSYSAGAVIEAKPMTVAELAAQAREEQSAQRARRDEEMEGEKEDAARALEEEFEEMDGLEQRFKTLQDRRDALRIPAVRQAVDFMERTFGNMEPESDSDDEDWDDFSFRPA